MRYRGALEAGNMLQCITCSGRPHVQEEQALAAAALTLRAIRTPGRLCYPEALPCYGACLRPPHACRCLHMSLSPACNRTLSTPPACVGKEMLSTTYFSGHPHPSCGC